MNAAGRPGGLVSRLRRSAFALPLAVTVAALMVGVSELGFREAHGQMTRLVVIVKVRVALTNVMRRVADAESGQRGYQLTGSDDYLTPYRDASLDVHNTLNTLRAHYRVLDDAAAEPRLDELAGHLRTKLREMDEVIALQQAGRQAAALALVGTGIGRDRMDSIRAITDALARREDGLLALAVGQVFDTLLLHRIGVAAMTAISVLVLGLYLRQRQTIDQQRALQQRAIQAERDRLEVDVHARTRELTELAGHLETAREDERARLARDLHDELGALLTAAKLDVARMRPKLAQLLPDLLPRVQHLVESLDSGIALKRRIIEDLRPSTLSNLGLLPALEILCAEFGDRLGVPLSTALAPVALTPSAELTVFRLVQEALTNIAKYAAASAVRVVVQSDGAIARISVHDDGRGFDTGAAGHARHGLIGMRYRVAAESGRLQVQSAPGQGTCITAELPQQPAAAPAPG